VVSKVFGPTPRTEKAEVMSLDSMSPDELSRTLIQKIFTKHPHFESDLLDRPRSTP
jgi:electron transfer flavoprotein beta subunit